MPDYKVIPRYEHAAQLSSYGNHVDAKEQILEVRQQAASTVKKIDSRHDNKKPIVRKLAVAVEKLTGKHDQLKKEREENAAKADEGYLLWREEHKKLERKNKAETRGAELQAPVDPKAKSKLSLFPSN